MLTKSVVGRFLMLAIFIVAVGVVAQAALIFTSGGKKGVKTASADVVEPAKSADAAAADPIRVVYPGPLGDTAGPPAKLADAAPSSPLAAPTPVTTAKLAQAMGGAAAATAPTPANGTPAVVATNTAPAPAAASTIDPSQAAPATRPASDQAAVAPSAAPAAAGVEVASLGGGAPAADASDAGGLNINTASVDALNHLGGGHIGQSIAKHRPYASIDDLVKKRVLRRSVFDRIRNQIAAK